MKKIYESIKEILSEANSKQAAPKYTTQQYTDWAKKYSEKHNVPYSMVLHSMYKETGRIGDPEKMRTARSNRGATGVMQIMPKYAEKGPYQIKPKDLTDPEKNIEAGVRGLSYFYGKYKDPQKALAAYNAGEGGARDYLKSGNPKTIRTRQTRDYIADYKDDVDYQLSKFFPKADKQASGGKTSVKPEKVEVKPEPAAQKTEVAPAAPKVEVKPQPAVEKSKPVEKTQSAVENPYTPGSLEHAFKQARIEGKPEFEFKGRKIKVELKKEPQGVNEAGMKNIYNAAKQILSEKAEAPSWGSNLMKLFKGETLTSPGREANLEKQAKAEREAEIERVNAIAAQRAKAEQDRKAAQAATQKINQTAIAALSPKRDDGTAQASSARGGKKPEKQAAPKKELSPFEQEFAAARAKGRKEFTWYDKQGRPYQVATKLKGEEEPPKAKAVAPETKPEKDTRTLPRTSQSRTQTRSVKTDTSADTSPVIIPKAEMDAIDAEKERQKKAAAAKPEVKPEEKPQAAPEPESNAVDQSTDKEEQPAEEPKKEKPKFDYTKGLLGQKNSNKTNEEKQMSLNKKFNVSDALYNSVMEVMAKSSGGTVPKNEKQKQLAAHHGDPNLITHGDVLKARGVKMKEETGLDEVVTLKPGVKTLDQKRQEYYDNEKRLSELPSVSLQKKPVPVKTINLANEEAEQVDELSRGKLVGYIEKASKTKGAEAIARVAGIKKAAQKLKDIKKQSMQSEDVEQVDEISKGTLGSYISKSADKAREHGFYGGVAFTKGKLDQSDYHAKKELKRTRGLNKAVSRLTKEEALDEAKKLISKHGEDQPISAKVYKDTEWNEYQVHYFKNGKHMGEGPVSHHDDKEDAQTTAEHEIKRMNSRKSVDESATQKILDVADAIGSLFSGEAARKLMEPKKDEKGDMKQTSQSKSGQKPEPSKKDKNVKEDWVDSKGKFHKEAPPPGQVPSPDEGYRPPKAQPKTPGKKTQPGSTTKAMDDVEEEVVQEMSSKMKMKLGLYNKKKSSVKENTDTPGNSYEHQCAIHVRSESFGDGRTITTQHADPDEYGNIEWYDVMFEHGIEKYVPTNTLEILVSESHMHSKRKKKVAEETGEERKAKLERDEDRFKAAEAGNYQGRNARGDVIKSGGEVVKGNPNPPSMVDRIKGKLGIPNTATDALGEPMYKSSRLTSGSGPRGGGGGGFGMMDPGAIKNLKKMY